MKFIFSLFILLFSGVSFAQSVNQKEQVLETKFSKFLHVEYEIVGVETPTPELLDQIPFLIYNQQRLESEDIQIVDPTTNYTILLYSHQKCAANKH